MEEKKYEEGQKEENKRIKKDEILDEEKEEEMQNEKNCNQWTGPHRKIGFTSLCCNLV
jgi:hypothetical protein